MTRQEEIPYTKEEVEAMVKTIEQLRKEKREFVDKACKWLFKHLGFFVTYFYEEFIEEIDRSDFIKNFRKAMEE